MEKKGDSRKGSSFSGCFFFFQHEPSKLHQNAHNVQMFEMYLRTQCIDRSYYYLHKFHAGGIDCMPPPRPVRLPRVEVYQENVNVGLLRTYIRCISSHSRFSEGQHASIVLMETKQQLTAGKKKKKRNTSRLFFFHRTLTAPRWHN